MTPSKKLFIAATLLSAGYGLATLFGVPDPRHNTVAPISTALPLRDAMAVAPQATSPSPMSNMVGSVRLLPDVADTTADGSGNAPARAADLSANAEIPTFTATAPNRPADISAEPSMPLLESRLKPNATLKDESPRPLPDEGRTARGSQTSQVNTTAYAPVQTADVASTASHVWTAGFTTAGVVSAGGNSTAPAVSPPLEFVRAVGVSPPPWPAAEPAPPRTHVIVDGDSLAKLAGRYLDDPRRSEEIFVLNRAVLTDPELLPIGAELLIPAPGSSVSTAHGATRPGISSGTSAVHSAAHTGLVPVRPVPATSGSIPRAQLLRPLPVE